jgi:hypothetical protein
MLNTNAMRSRVALAVTTATPICVAILAGCGGSSLHLVFAQVARQRADGVYSHWRYDTMHFPPHRPRARPRLVEHASDPSFAVDVSAIERAIDPVWHGGLSYHAFSFEARDGDGVPFIATQHSTVNGRGQLEGEQWARGSTLCPFPHG